VDGNYLDAEAIFELVTALFDNEANHLATFSCQNQLGLQSKFGRKVEKAVADLASKKKSLTRLGFLFQNEALHTTADKAIRQNRDAQRRRRRRASAQAGKSKMKEEQEFSALLLTAPPDRAVMEFFQEGDGMDLVREFASKKGRVPTREQLQAFARHHGMPLKYSEVAPVARNFRTVLLDSFVGASVIGKNESGGEFKGQLQAWTEKNEHWDLSLAAEDRVYHLESRKDIAIEVADEVAVWLWYE